jgi:membrane peptidoglycan carboxypeptidase
VPSHDETVPPRGGSVRRPPPARTAGTGGGGGTGRDGGGPSRSSGGGRARTTAARAGAAPGGTSPAEPASRPSGGKGPGKGKGKGKPPRSKKQRRRRRLKIALGGVLGLVVLFGVFVGVVYASTDVPDPGSVVNAQTTILYYADGTTEMARLGDENRTNVTLAQIAEPARNAVLAAENRSFYTDPGISFTGILRAAYNDLTGGSTQGGSTITQQYVKNAFLTQDQTFSRKFKELFLAIKLDNNYSKDEILENYLNTIYFGRGAYGIEAAANTFFGVPAAQLTAQQGAVLAVLIRNPTANDPETNPQGAQSRWSKVLDAMVSEGWLSSADRSASVYPPVLPKASSSLGIPQGPEGLIVQQAIDELESKGYTEQQIRAGGLRITTTIDPKAQTAAVTSVNDVMADQPQNLRQALVAVDPKTGAVRAYYGGPSGTGNDYAQSQRQPGSSMKPYVLATALEHGISDDARRNGSSPQTFPDRTAPVRNAGNEACASCTLTQAITESLNTTFYGLAYELGADNVRDVALKAMGMPQTWQGGLLDGKKTLASPETGVTGSSIGIGEYELRPVDQAVGYATFADGGVHHAPFFVSKVTDNTGAVLLQYNGDTGDQAVPADVANDVTFALEGVAQYSHRALAGGRQVASKTGTQGKQDSTVDDTDAYMVGYTPSISAAVWMGSDAQDAIVNALGKPIYGSGLPGAIWQEFMNTLLQGTPKEPLPTSSIIKGDTGHGVADPTEDTTPVTQADPSQTSSAPTQSTTGSTTGTGTTTTGSTTGTTTTGTTTGTTTTGGGTTGTSTGGSTGTTTGGSTGTTTTGGGTTGTTTTGTGHGVPAPGATTTGG